MAVGSGRKEGEGGLLGHSCLHALHLFTYRNTLLGSGFQFVSAEVAEFRVPCLLFLPTYLNSDLLTTSWDF